MTFNHTHLLSLDDYSKEDITHLLDLAEAPQSDKLAGKTVITLFYENSTRTRVSFTIAAQQLGAHVIDLGLSTSSVKKKETLADTIQTLNAMGPAALIIRHMDAATPQIAANNCNCAVINAGAGADTHPTQALLDALTIRQYKGRLEGLKVAICGDITHSRVAASNKRLLNKMGVEVVFVGPEDLTPKGAIHNLEDGIKNADVVMMLRIQKERMDHLRGDAGLPPDNTYFQQWGLTHAKLKAANPDAIVLHPGPINRGVEIDGALADDRDKSAILTQVTNGIPVRMACLSALIQ